MPRRLAAARSRALHGGCTGPTGPAGGPAARARSCGARGGRARLQEGWVIANHILVSFHVAFISSVLALPAERDPRRPRSCASSSSARRRSSRRSSCTSASTPASPLHELGHFLAAARLHALNDSAGRRGSARLRLPLPRRALCTLPGCSCCAPVRQGRRDQARGPQLLPGRALQPGRGRRRPARQPQPGRGRAAAGDPAARRWGWAPGSLRRSTLGRLLPGHRAWSACSTSCWPTRASTASSPRASEQASESAAAVERGAGWDASAAGGQAPHASRGACRTPCTRAWGRCTRPGSSATAAWAAATPRRSTPSPTSACRRRCS